MDTTYNFGVQPGTGINREDLGKGRRMPKRVNPLNRMADREVPIDYQGIDPALAQTLHGEVQRTMAQKAALAPMGEATVNPVQKVLNYFRRTKATPPAARPGIDRPLTDVERNAMSRKYLGR